MVREGMKEEKERFWREKKDRDKKKFRGMLMMNKNEKKSQAMKSDVNLIEFDTTTTQSIDKDEMINGWPLTRSSPSHHGENNVTLGGGLEIMTQYMDGPTEDNNLQVEMELAPDLAAVGISDYVLGD